MGFGRYSSTLFAHMLVAEDGWECFLGLLSRTSGVKDGDTKESRKQWTDPEEGKNTTTTLQYHLYLASHIIFMIFIRCARDTKTIKCILFKDFLRYLFSVCTV